MKRTLLDAIATTRAVAEYWLSFAIAVVAELWRPTGRHRRGWREPSTFEFAAEEWGRMSRVIEAERQPVPEPLEAPKPPTIGERARDIPAGSIFDGTLAASCCPECGGDGGTNGPQRKPGPIVHCDQWEAAA